MDTAASAGGLSASLKVASPGDLSAALKDLSAEDIAKLKSALNSLDGGSGGTKVELGKPEPSPAETPQDVLRFWYRDCYPKHPHLLNDGNYMFENLPRWMLAQDNMDEEATIVFTDLVRKLGKRDYNSKEEESSWWKTNDGLLAQVLCLDQLSRNCFRGKAEAYAYDEVSHKVVEQILENMNGDPAKLVDNYAGGDCIWISIALQHTEDLVLHDKEFEIYDAVEVKHPSLAKFLAECRKHGKSHTDVLKRFGRYPHRNMQLGRENTTEEAEWLKDFANLPPWAKSQIMAQGEFQKACAGKSTV